MTSRTTQDKTVIKTSRPRVYIPRWLAALLAPVAILIAVSGFTAGPAQAGGSSAFSVTNAAQLLSNPLSLQAGSPDADPVLVGAGDIATCSGTGDERTAALLDNIAGTVFTLGDNAYDNGTATEFANCYNPSWGRHKARTYPAAGNHEYFTTNAAPYYSYFGAAAGDPAKGYYSYEVGTGAGTWHIIVLNSNCTFVPCAAGSAQEQWLRHELAANMSKNVLAYWHHPRFSSGALHGNDTSVQPFWQALYEYGADLVLVGHAHGYERFAPQNNNGALDTTYGIREFVVGTGGKSHQGFATPVANSEVRADTYFGVLKVTLHPNSYDWQFVPEAGGTFNDHGTALTHGIPNVGGTPLPTATAGTVTPTPTACALTFSDVPVGSTFYPFVRCLACQGILGGYADGTFHPNNNITRGQLAKIVSNSAGYTDPAGAQTFQDVPPGSTFYDFVQRLASRGYMNGYPCGGPGEPCGTGNLLYFRPNANATRGQISKIVANAAGYTEPAGAQSFEDVPPGSTFYDFVQRLASRDIMNGYPCGGPSEPCTAPANLPYFRPGSSATRGQTAKIVSNTFFPGCNPAAKQ
ncbi:MAG: S-layer homology domain-containing protein [Chloroflexota bacterium]